MNDRTAAWKRDRPGCYRNDAEDEIVGSVGEWFLFPHGDTGMYGPFRTLAEAKQYVEDNRV